MKKKRALPSRADFPAVTLAAELNPAAVMTEKNASLSSPETGRQDLYLILALLAAAFAVRLYSLQFFHVIPTDGTSYALTARAVAHGDWHGVGTYGLYPLLIVVANWFVNDLETAGRMVSVIYGSFLVVPLYFLGKTLFSRNIAIAACLITIVWPSMVSYSCEVVTQATYTTLQLAAVYCIWRAFMMPTVLSGCMAGLFMGLSYLTRPEAILLSVVIPAALCLFSWQDLRGKRLFFWTYIGSFLLLFTINMLLVHHVSGEWQLSAKTDSALNDALSYYLNIPDINYIPGYEPKGYLDIIREHPAFLWKNSLVNLLKVWQTMLPLPLWLLFFAGFLSGGFAREMNRIRLFLLATFAPLAVIIVFYYIDGGYIQAYQPVMFLFAAAGFAAVEDKLNGYLPHNVQVGTAHLLKRAPLLLLATAIYAVALFAPQIRKDISDAEYKPEMDDCRRAEKHIGLLLKNNLPAGKIMTRWARIAFYAEREWVNVPAGVELEEVIRTARDNSVRYLIVDDMLYGMRPKLGLEIFAPFADKATPPGLLFNNNPGLRVKGLHPFLVYTDPDKVGVIVYEIPPEKS